MRQSPASGFGPLSTIEHLLYFSRSQGDDRRNVPRGDVFERLGAPPGRRDDQGPGPKVDPCCPIFHSLLCVSDPLTLPLRATSAVDVSEIGQCRPSESACVMPTPVVRTARWGAQVARSVSLSQRQSTSLCNSVTCLSESKNLCNFLTVYLHGVLCSAAHMFSSSSKVST